jgi:hypothetical protein
MIQSGTDLVYNNLTTFKSEIVQSTRGTHHSPDSIIDMIFAEIRPEDGFAAIFFRVALRLEKIGRISKGNVVTVQVYQFLKARQGYS